MNRRSLLQGLCKISGKRLPSEYARVEYLESTGTQYIDTDYYAKSSTKVALAVSNLSCANNSYGWVFRSWTSWHAAMFGLFVYDSGDKVQGLFGAQEPTATINHLLEDGGLHNIDFSQTGLFIDDSSVCAFSAATFEAANPMTIFGDTGDYNAFIITKLHSFKIYELNTLVRYFVPVVRLSDMKPGLYDYITGQFYVNQGTGEFLYGGLLPAEYQQVEYIESTGTQYIDTGVIPNQNTNTIISLKITPTGGNSGILGARISSTSQNYGLVLGYQNGVYLTSGFGDNNEMHSYAISADVRYLINKNRNKVYINNSLIYEQDMQTFNPGYTMYLFAVNQVDAAQFMSVAKLYSCQIYDNGSLVRAFIPCYRKSDNEIGLYDLIHGVFYTNQGTGTFLKGPNV